MTKPKCRSCGKPVCWVKLPSGKAMPIDPEPHGLGNVALHLDALRGVVLSNKQIAEYEGRIPLYRSHFATCAHANKHRKATSPSTDTTNGTR